MNTEKFILLEGQKIFFTEIEKKSIAELREMRSKIIESLSIIKAKLLNCDTDDRKNKLFFVKNKIGEALNFIDGLLSKLKKIYKPIPSYFMEAAEIILDKDQFDFILLNAKDKKNADVDNKILD